ncbi:hypothetical protein L2755_15520 [Shewanella abyssi]|uniref:hypothetical protein n=1 Tax=Shewanella abyssi TaxID=311789 RepID=UPI00200C7421|nr:hypothetical protein [Shewanella abyssi]MCL1051026.1 hypothetical protein [Shewanella abyssi]
MPAKLVVGILLTMGCANALAQPLIDTLNIDLAATTRYYFEETASPQINIDDLAYGARGEIQAAHRFGPIKLDGKLFAQWDSADDNRRYTDIRQAKVSGRWGNISVAGGIDTFFWGVSESINLVNVINQSDIRESLDTKVKQGQVFASLSYRLDAGELGVYFIPTFTARDFPLRPAYGLPISEQNTFEDNKEDGGIAARGLFYIDDVEFAIGYFSGTRRDPLLIPSQQTKQLIPYYIQTENLLFDAVYLTDSLTYKWEFKTGRELERGFVASNIGIEYPLYVFADTIQDLVVITEYVFDDRGERAESHGQNDLFIGTKFEFAENAAQIRLLYSYDFDYASQYAELSCQYRLSDYLRIKAKVMGVLSASQDDRRLYALKNEEFAKFSLHYAF